MRTRQTHPLQIALVATLPAMGAIGLTFCPGKVQPDAKTGAWSRDLDAVAAWGAVAVLTLVEPQELHDLQVPGLGAAVRDRHMDWFHLPIPDCATPSPDFEDQGASAGENLRSRLRAGFPTLVHCKGGLGRAGTITARLLVEQGLPAAEAIARVRAARPGAIETVAQEAHVLDIAPVAKPEPDTSFPAICDRAIGAFLGLAVGDAVGTTLEFAARDQRPRLADMVGGGPFGLLPGRWTDDTAMALALGDSLAADPGLDPVDLMTRLVAWWRDGTYSGTRHCFDIRITTSEALSRFLRTGDPMAGSADLHKAGNGSLMRLAPVAIRHHRNRPLMRDVAARQSRTTHAAPKAVEACVAYAELLADATEGQRRSEVLRARHTAFAGSIADILRGSWRGKPRQKVRASGYVAHALEAALWSVGRGGDFRSTILTAANLAEDADTTAAVAGQLAGALDGAGAIPPDWRQRLAWGDRIAALADDLVTARAA